MKTLTILIPTEKRELNDFEYFSQCINNSHLCINADIYIFMNEKYIDEINDICKNINKRYIYRSEEDELYKSLNIWKNDSYNYWRSHLCLDFVYSMEKVIQMTNSTHYMWLEDDTILTKNFENIFQNEDAEVTNYYHGGGCGGFCCMVFEKNFLITFIEFIKSNYMEDIPLDYMLEKMNKRYVYSKIKCGYHIGKISTRKDNKIIRKVDLLV